MGLTLVAKLTDLPRAQAARQQGKYLARRFNAAQGGRAPAPRPSTHISPPRWTDGRVITEDSPKYQFVSLGSMASVGGWTGVTELGKDKR